MYFINEREVSIIAYTDEEKRHLTSLNYGMVSEYVKQISI